MGLSAGQETVDEGVDPGGDVVVEPVELAGNPAAAVDDLDAGEGADAVLFLDPVGDGGNRIGNPQVGGEFPYDAFSVGIDVHADYLQALAGMA